LTKFKLFHKNKTFHIRSFGKADCIKPKTPNFKRKQGFSLHAIKMLHFDSNKCSVNELAVGGWEKNIQSMWYMGPFFPLSSYETWTLFFLIQPIVNDLCGALFSYSKVRTSGWLKCNKTIFFVPVSQFNSQHLQMSRINSNFIWFTWHTHKDFYHRCLISFYFANVLVKKPAGDEKIKVFSFRHRL